jgi:hypothetical protein
VQTGLVRVDPEPEQSERALVEVLAAENDAPLRPPTPNPALLPFGELSPPAFERLVAEVVLYVDGLQQVIPEVTMILRLTRGRRKISGCARDDAGRSVVPVSPF